MALSRATKGYNNSRSQGMTTRIVILGLALAALVAAPATATIRKNYELKGEQQVRTPVGTTVRPPGTWEARTMRATVIDDEAGTVTLDHYRIANNYHNEFDAAGTTGIPNCFAETEIHSYFEPALPVSTSGTILGGTLNFGALTGWARGGEIWCFERIYSGTYYYELFPGFFVGIPIPPVLSEGNCGGCDNAAGLVHNGWGPGPPMFSTTYNLDPFTFDGTGNNFTVGGEMQTFETNSGLVTGFIANVSGAWTVQGAPALLPLGVAALGASLTLLGAHSLRRKA